MSYRSLKYSDLISIMEKVTAALSKIELITFIFLFFLFITRNTPVDLFRTHFTFVPYNKIYCKGSFKLASI